MSLEQHEIYWAKKPPMNPEVIIDDQTIQILQRLDKKLREIEQYVASELLGLTEPVWENHEIQDGYEAGKQEILEAIQKIIYG